MYFSQDIANRIKSEAKKRGISINRLLGDCNLGVNTISKMAKGTDILTHNFAKIADYLGCSVDYLLGRTDNPNINGEYKTIADMLQAYIDLDKLDNINYSIDISEDSSTVSISYKLDKDNSESKNNKLIEKLCELKSIRAEIDNLYKLYDAHGLSDEQFNTLMQANKKQISELLESAAKETLSLSIRADIEMVDSILKTSKKGIIPKTYYTISKNGFDKLLDLRQRAENNSPDDTISESEFISLFKDYMDGIEKPLDMLTKEIAKRISVQNDDWYVTDKSTREIINRLIKLANPTDK